ncbi:MAG: hypothetical protein K5782_09430 [Nitrosarchaeum sp.]|uniref:Uncharacterized protein n=1 Tax=Nitrosarchaeum koreense MY1 TaxID=1001994 RepID=F9CZ79_9ARCH|nr:hypothetical protein [Nitrosarchaeum koreense]EGP94237.1 hypothetical protein MY1_1482 [Nitrosarchaeum koreense MY1]MCV0413205.1 hypothetical protein [Nitrosarchaeum sp.]HSA75934.1 hypothetical protein [Nitrosarchaeum sp.]
MSHKTHNHQKTESMIKNVKKRTVETTCFVCGIEIIQYYSDSYKGERGWCLGCGSDFPLE